MANYRTQDEARTAAKKQLGAKAIEGADFTVKAGGGGTWTWKRVPAVTAPAKKAQAKRQAKVPTKGFRGAAARNAAATTKPAAPEGNTKQDMLVAMMQKPGGATSKEMEAATGWLPHSVRGLIGTLKKRGVNVESKKIKGEPTYYRIPAQKPAGEVGDVL